MHREWKGDERKAGKTGVAATVSAPACLVSSFPASTRGLIGCACSSWLVACFYLPATRALRWFYPRKSDTLRRFTETAGRFSRRE